MWIVIFIQYPAPFEQSIPVLRSKPAIKAAMRFIKCVSGEKTNYWSQQVLINLGSFSRDLIHHSTTIIMQCYLPDSFSKFTGWIQRRWRGEILEPSILQRWKLPLQSRYRVEHRRSWGVGLPRQLREHRHRGMYHRRSAIIIYTEKEVQFAPFSQTAYFGKNH